MKFEAHVSDDFMIDGVAVYLSRKFSAENRSILRFGADDQYRWEEHEPLTNVQPSFRLDGEMARTLLDALLRFYQGSADTQTLRSDLLHERSRVDKLIETLTSLALVPAGMPLPDPGGART